MKLLDIIFENKAEEALEQELRNQFNMDNIFVHMGVYSQDREDDDPLKGKGFGNVMFRLRSRVDDSVFKKIVKILQSKGFEITQEANDFDDDGDRYFYPRINFNYKLS
tara:strand:+ start:708 stop:1031 length:324 start_codon:yes stop_codon:yes gene_type:complete